MFVQDHPVAASCIAFLAHTGAVWAYFPGTSSPGRGSPQNLGVDSSDRDSSENVLEVVPLSARRTSGTASSEPSNEFVEYEETAFAGRAPPPLLGELFVSDFLEEEDAEQDSSALQTLPLGAGAAALPAVSAVPGGLAGAPSHARAPGGVYPSHATGGGAQLVPEHMLRGPTTTEAFPGRAVPRAPPALLPGRANYMPIPGAAAVPGAVPGTVFPAAVPGAVPGTGALLPGGQVGHPGVLLPGAVARSRGTGLITSSHRNLRE